MLAADFHGNRQHGRKADNIVVPESAVNFRQVGFVQKRAIARRLQVNAADFHIERVFLRRDDQIRAVAAQFAVDLVADVGGDGDHSRRDRNAQRDGNARQQFAPRLPAERFVDEAQKHYYLLEVCGCRPRRRPRR